MLAVNLQSWTWLFFRQNKKNIRFCSCHHEFRRDRAVRSGSGYFRGADGKYSNGFWKDFCFEVTLGHSTTRKNFTEMQCFAVPWHRLSLQALRGYRKWISSLWYVHFKKNIWHFGKIKRFFQGHDPGRNGAASGYYWANASGWLNSVSAHLFIYLFVGHCFAKQRSLRDADTTPYSVRQALCICRTIGSGYKLDVCSR